MQKNSLSRLIFLIVTAICLMGFAGSSVAATIYIPHVTGGYDDWSDTLLVDNSSLASADYTIILYDATGAEVYNQSHSVGKLSQDVIFLKNLNATAQCGEITYTEEMLFFRVSYENTGGGGVAEFKLTDSLNTTLAFYFNNSASFLEWKGLALTNFSNSSTDIALYAIGGGSVLGSASITLPANGKVIGLHTAWFPSIDLVDLDKIVAVASTATLCGIAKNGDLANTKLLFVSADPVSNFRAEDFSIADFVGTWNGTWTSMANLGESGNLSLEINSVVKIAIGSMDISNTDCGDLEDIIFIPTVKDNTLSFAASSTCFFTTLSLEYTKGILNGNTITGSYTINKGKITTDAGIFSVTKPVIKPLPF